ncbi:MAG: sulfatase-like hydrolase/transferase [Chitinophagaceae bacterium]|nr:sulfatase-like hydrolase/transferase [Chitinophagaceae bacterium]MCW5904505.1 sulfatase-like hydrolase/transferase [Chitinophagaceae bacterium]
MLIKWKVPKTIQWVIRLFFIFLLVFTLFRITTYWAFKPDYITFKDVWSSFIMGARFDIRWISILLIPIVLLSFVPKLSPYSSFIAKRVWIIYLATITFFIMFFFGADYGHFAYVSTRLNASALNFAEDAKISFEMLWESYPIFWLLIALIIMAILFHKLYKATYQRVEINNTEAINYRRRWYAFIAFLLFLGIYGKLSTNPLKWKDAFVYKDNFKSYLALNPLQNFFTTLRFRKPQVDNKIVHNSYNSIADFLQLNTSTKKQTTFKRWEYPNSHALESKPNIVLVICESFSMYKSSMSGNPLNATPYFDTLSKQGIFFNHCFTPHFATARGVFAVLTGIPDVQLSKFSSRNEESIHQHTIINNFEDYEKFYFIGGSSEFNNYKGLLSNIKNLHLYEEGNYTSPKVNVWGISDKDLFTESNHILAKQDKPFFAIIQTAGNHRPYTIPETDKDFVKQHFSKDTLKKYGFESDDEYNAFAYMDYAIAHFMNIAKKQPYFHNTIFVFIGDHGVEGNASAMYPSAWTTNRLSDEHVPLLFYAPSLLSPKQYNKVVSQIDVLPTIAGMIYQPYYNTTLGRDILKPTIKTNGAFIIHHDEGKIGWLTDSFYFVKNIRFEQEELIPVQSDSAYWTPQQAKLIKKRFSSFTTAFYETAKWMLINNKEP